MIAFKPLSVSHLTIIIAEYVIWSPVKQQIRKNNPNGQKQDADAC